ncbi:hypothetical protein Tco_0961691 [Tanacetum coccineum]
MIDILTPSVNVPENCKIKYKFDVSGPPDGLEFLENNNFYSWLSRDGLNDVIKAAWSSLENNNNNGRILKSHEKLRSLKASIKQWYVNINNLDRNRKHDNVKLIEKRIDDVIATPSDRDTRMQLLK